MEYAGIEYLGVVNEAKGEMACRMNEAERTQEVLLLLMRNKAVLERVIGQLKESMLLRGEDREDLARVSEALVNGREAGSLTYLGQRRPALIALLVAYAVYEVWGA